MALSLPDHIQGQETARSRLWLLLVRLIDRHSRHNGCICPQALDLRRDTHQPRLELDVSMIPVCFDRLSPANRPGYGSVAECMCRHRTTHDDHPRRAFRQEEEHPRRQVDDPIHRLFGRFQNAQRIHADIVLISAILDRHCFGSTHPVCCSFSLCRA
jgi:hypothetical protein